MKSGEIIETLKKCTLFKDLNDEELDKLADLCTVEERRAGEAMYTQGQPGEKLFLLSKGQVSLHRNYKLHTSRVADVVVYISRETGNRRLLGGWLALVGKEHVHMCSAKCDKVSRLVVIDGASLRKFVLDKPDVYIKIMEMLIVILRDRLESSYDSFESI